MPSIGGKAVTEAEGPVLRRAYHEGARNPGLVRACVIGTEISEPSFILRRGRCIQHD